MHIKMRDRVFECYHSASVRLMTKDSKKNSVCFCSLFYIQGVKPLRYSNSI
jgi:hypothetical protein